MRPMTVENVLEDAREARAKGYDELADELDAIADVLARANERSTSTLQEARERMGEERFRALLRQNYEREVDGSPSAEEGETDAC